MKVRNMVLRVIAGLGAIIGYGCLLAFLCLVGVQAYRWFREGEWMHVGMGDGIGGSRRRHGSGCTRSSKSFRHHWLCSP